MKQNIYDRPDLSDHLRRPPILVLAGVKRQEDKNKRKNYVKC